MHWRKRELCIFETDSAGIVWGLGATVNMNVKGFDRLIFLLAGTWRSWMNPVRATRVTALTASAW